MFIKSKIVVHHQFIVSLFTVLFDVSTNWRTCYIVHFWIESHNVHFVAPIPYCRRKWTFQWIASFMASWMYSGLQLRNENSARITTYWSPFWSKIVKLTYIMRVRCRSDHEITVTDAQMNDMVVSLAVSVPSQITIPKRVLVSSKRTQKACIRMWFDYPNWFVLFRNRNNSKKPFVRLFHFHSDNISRKFRYFFSNASSAVVAIDIRISASYSYHEYQPDAQKRINGGIMRAQQLWIDSHIGERYWGWPYSDSSIVTFIPCICHINQRRWQWSVVDCTIDTKCNWPRHLYCWKWYEKKVGTISRCCHSISKQRLFWQGEWISDWYMVYGKLHLQCSSLILVWLPY